MAIIKDLPSAPPALKPNTPKIEPKNAHSVIVDNSVIPHDSLIVHSRGIALVTDYYRLVINKDSALYAQDVGQSGVQQQYLKYKNLEIRQQGSLSEDQNDEDKVFVIRGSAIVHSGLIPNEGDMFAADVGDGRLGVFNVTRSQRMSMMKDTVYMIEYALAYFAADEAVQYKDLESKVIDTYFYVKGRIDYNDSPFLTSEQYNFYRQLRAIYEQMSLHYAATFFSKEYASYVVPDQDASTFDYFVYKALRTIFKEDIYGVVQKQQAINIADDDILNRGRDIFTSLLRREPSNIIHGDQRTGLARTDTFHFEGFTTNIRYTGLRMVVYPLTFENRADTNYNHNERSVLGGPLRASPEVTNPVYLQKTISNFILDNKEVPLIKPVSIDDYYVFSEDFYNETENLSVLEAQVMNYLHGKTLNASALKVLCEQYLYWPRLERFYYIPVLLILIQSILKDL
jgi:hypothetical protein